MDNKNELRKQMKYVRDNLMPDEVEVYSKAICANLIKTGLPDMYELVLLFAPVNNEPDMFIIHDMIKQNREETDIAYPLVASDKKHMDYYLVNDYSKELKKGYMNIKEPDETTAKLIKPEEYLDNNKRIAVIVPGLVFDKAGNRTGYGGGYYDRFLGKYADNGNLVKIAVCYEFQMHDEEIYHERHDIVMDYVVTEKNIYRISGERGV